MEEFAKLPGIGTRTAERLAYFVLKSPSGEALELAAAIREVKEKLVSCRECLAFSPREICEICADPERDRRLLMVVEHPRDLAAFEQTGLYRGLYHVLLGHVSPHEGTGARHLSLDRLHQRVQAGDFGEVILATNPTAEGDGTALTLEESLRNADVEVTRLARGLPSGFSIEYAGTEVLADALEGRRSAQEPMRAGDEG
jgi:recombination protein RecR